MPLITITANSQLPLGQAELHHLGIQPGDMIELDHLPGGGLLLKPAKAKKTILPFIGGHAVKAGELPALERFFHSLDGKASLDAPLTIDAMNAIIAAGWAGELKPE